MRYAIKYTKNSEIKFVSHLDLMRTLQRVVRRSGLPAEYSKGYNPHMTMSIAQPLSVGIYSEGEYMDVVFNDEIDENYIKAALNDNTPMGIEFKEVIRVLQGEGKKVPQLMALVEAAGYIIKIRYEETRGIKEKLEKLLAAEEWTTLKKSKSGEKMVDIKPMLRKLSYEIEGKELQLNAIVSCGSRENLSPELLGSFIKENIEGALENAFVDIRRYELYTEADKGILPIDRFLKEEL